MHMKRLLLLLLCMSLAAAQLLAQNRTIIGRITDSIGTYIPNASVTVKNSKIGTTTDAGGNFSLSVPSNASVLVISSVGYADQEVNIGDRSNITITLQGANAALNEVVVTAYGATQK